MCAKMQDVNGVDEAELKCRMLELYLQANFVLDKKNSVQCTGMNGHEANDGSFE